MAAFADYINDPRFHQTFQLPADPASGCPRSFRVKYTDYGYRKTDAEEEENVLLFFSPLMASRLLFIAKDELAKKHKIRVITVDRPGIGGTDPVDTKDGLTLWRRK
jgi:hypothetical protein